MLISCRPPPPAHTCSVVGVARVVPTQPKNGCHHCWQLAHLSLYHPRRNNASVAVKHGLKHILASLNGVRLQVANQRSKELASLACILSITL